MASLATDSRGRSPFWICCYTSGTGQRLKKSTKVSIRPYKGEKSKDGSPKTVADKRAEAWEVCLSIDRAENHARNGTLTEQQARKIISEILERTTGAPLHNYKVRDWLNDWLDMKEKVRAWTTMRRYRQTIRDFVTSLGNRANLGLAHLSPKDVLTYRDSITKVGNSPRSANLSSDVANMRWDAIDWHNKVIRFTPSKTKKPVTIPLHRDLERELLKTAGIGRTPIFPSLAGKITAGKSGLSGGFAAVMKKAGIEGKRLKPGGVRTRSSLSFHSLRHS